ncbi:hypothetical protein AZL_d01250 (plasmid) [Azospirillum sp. B510]|uniref:DUF4347 domain-containing protein n=1 Tax=Azospirillum sp. (strain B510) TaxID=137722 RepID=UPI0001C4CCE5|nr:DUF4347 domain-containing protein [Azospirillum sp. B510]BAI75951.1 hypothetical protein AZL_d01250 [Azospirillum sp. B510]
MHGIILADAGLADIDALIGRQAPDVTVVRVAADEDALGLLADALEMAGKMAGETGDGAGGACAVHLVAHGAPGVVKLGAMPLDAGALLDRRWPDATGCEILIHACDVGAGDRGRHFVERLAAVTGARVAAASHPVGHAGQGGSWDLDVVTGPIRASRPFAGAEAWPHRLAYRGTATSGNDTLIGDNGGNTINGLAGNDSIVGGTGNDSLIGGLGDDTLVGGGNSGQSAGDTLNGGLGADHYIGGNGFTIVTYENATTGITLDLTNGANNTGEAAGDSFVDIQRWVGSEHADSLTAGDTAVWFWGHGGDDVEHGGAGNDTLEAGDGNDSVFGGGGNDLIYGRADNDQLHGQTGNDTVAGGGGADLIYGDAGNDLLKGDWERDTVHGGDGDDTILAGIVTSGSYAQTQNDLVYGDAGNDRYIVVSQYDAGTVSFDGGTGADTLELRSDDLTSYNGYNLEYYTDVASPKIDISGMTLTSVETLALTGSRRHSVTMTAAQANGFDSITGAATGDAFAIVGASLSGTVGSGGGGALQAGQVQAETVNGVTLVHVGLDAAAGADMTLRIAGSFAASDIHLSGNTITLGQPGTGGPGDGGGGGPGGTAGQILTGTDGQDYLAGGSGNDTIISGAGNDYMTGGGGSDVFVFKPGDGWDYVGDFQAGNGGDVLNVAGWSGLKDFASVMAVTVQDGANTVVNFDNGNSAILANTSRGSLTAANFSFTAIAGTAGSGGAGGTGGGGTSPGRTVTGTSAGDYLAGGGGDDTIIGGAGNDYMVGGAGRDIFVQHAGDGWDCIGDFQAGTGGDVIDIRGIAGFTSLNDVLTHSAQEGADLSIDFGGTSTIKLMSVDRNSLTAENFLFASLVG